MPKVVYTRFANDWLISTNNKHTLRKAIKNVHRILHQLKLRMHPQKTFIGRATKGFNFLGYHIKPKKIQLSIQTIKNLAEGIRRRLYEQTGPTSQDPVGAYLTRWHNWTKAGLRSTPPRILPADTYVAYLTMHGYFQT